MLLKQSLRDYQKAGISNNPDKAFRFEQTFETWGTELNGNIGECGAPSQRRRQIARLGGAIFFPRAASQEILRAYRASHSSVHAPQRLE